MSLFISLAIVLTDVESFSAVCLFSGVPHVLRNHFVVYHIAVKHRVLCTCTYQQASYTCQHQQPHILAAVEDKDSMFRNSITIYPAFDCMQNSTLFFWFYSVAIWSWTMEGRDPCSNLSIKYECE